MDISAAIHYKWDGVRDKVMEGFSLPALWRIPLTSLKIVVDVARHLASATPLTARRESSSRRITTSSVMGFLILQSEAFNSTKVHDNLKMYTGCAICGVKDKLKESPLQEVGELKGDILIRYLWIQGMYIIQDMQFLNTDATFYQSKYTDK